jgi:arylsulfatase A-like enzyme
MVAASRAPAFAESKSTKPNLIFIMPDQWRAQATGYNGDPNLQGKTPNLDKLAAESLDFTTAVSCCPVCTPYRASLITGQYPLTTGVFLNDVCLGHPPLPQCGPKAVSIAEAYKSAGYETAYVGKWHIDGHGRSSYIPPERRQGFDYWKALECTHDYNHSSYYDNNDPTKRCWDGYDVIAQTKDAEQYIRNHARAEKPFCLFLAWGPPHNPYETAPEKYRAMFDPKQIKLRPNVKGGSQFPGIQPAQSREDSAKDLAGYYAHIAAMDDCLGGVVRTLEETGIANDTILVFTSDHGDMLGSQGELRKQRPWDESILVPFLIRYPGVVKPRKVPMPINTPDIMPTLLGLSGVAIPKTVEGTDYSRILGGGKAPDDNAALIMCASPFGEYIRPHGREYRGIRTRRYTYARDLNGPWLLYDNERDPYQLDNLIGRPEAGQLAKRMESLLQKELDRTHDEFLPGQKLIKKWGYTVDENGTAPYGP